MAILMGGMTIEEAQKIVDKYAAKYADGGGVGEKEYFIYGSKNRKDVEKYIADKKYNVQYREDFEDLFDIKITEVPYDDFTDYRIIAVKKHADGGSVGQQSLFTTKHDATDYFAQNGFKFGCGGNVKYADGGTVEPFHFNVSDFEKYAHQFVIDKLQPFGAKSTGTSSFELRGKNYEMYTLPHTEKTDKGTRFKSAVIVIHPQGYEDRTVGTVAFDADKVEFEFEIDGLEMEIETIKDAFAKGGGVDEVVTDTERANKSLALLKENGKLRRYVYSRGKGNPKFFETIIENKDEKGTYKRYESRDKSLGILQNQYLTEQEVYNHILKTLPELSKYDTGGGVDDLYVAVGEKDGYWTVVSTPSTKAKAEKLLKITNLPKGETGKVVSVTDVKNHKKVIGIEYLNYANGGGVTTFYTIRKDLIKQKQKVPVGEFYVGEGTYEGRYVDEDTFQIKYNGSWNEAESIDWEMVKPHKAQATNKSFAKGGSVHGEKRYSVYAHTDMFGDDFTPIYESNSLGLAIAYAKKKSKEKHPDMPPDFDTQYSDCDLYTEVFDTERGAIVADFAQGEPNYIEKIPKALPKKYIIEEDDSIYELDYKQVAKYWSKDTGATNNPIKIIMAKYPTANKDMLENLRPIFAASYPETKQKGKEILHDFLIKNKAEIVGATNSALWMLYKLHYKIPTDGVEIKGVDYAKDETVNS
jgi:hypothetical protein